MKVEQSTASMARYVEHGRYLDDEVDLVVARVRTASYPTHTLVGRPWLAVSLPGAAITAMGSEVIFGAPRGAMTDDTIRAAATACADLWLDARWYPADVRGYDLVLATTITVSEPAGIDPVVADLLDVPADDVRRAPSGGDGPLRFVRLAWRPGRQSRVTR
jgi:hypothetical protein